jgi:hypothetical protein
LVNILQQFASCIQHKQLINKPHMEQ